jgi:hypothetical protein
MKRGIYKYTIIIGLILIVGIGIYYFINNYHQNNEIPNNEGNFSSQAILNIILPEINDYCKTLNDNAIHSSCPTCTHFVNDKNETYVYVNNISEDDSYETNKYTIENEGTNYIVNMKLHLIYGRNDRPGEVTLYFEINSNGKIVDKNLPVKACV